MRLITLSTAIALTLASPSVFAFGKKKAEAERQALERERAETQAMVDKEMLESVQNINNSLNVLVDLNRGGEGPRTQPAKYGNTSPDPLAQTVAGQMRQPYSNARMPDMAPLIPPKTYQEIQRELGGYSVLDTRIEISWTGSPEGLLSSLADRVGYRFMQGSAKVGAYKRGGYRPITVNERDISVKDLLEKVSAHLNSQADVFVSVPQKTISLLRK